MGHVILQNLSRSHGVTYPGDLISPDLGIIDYDAEFCGFASLEDLFYVFPIKILENLYDDSFVVSIFEAVDIKVRYRQVIFNLPKSYIKSELSLYDLYLAKQQSIASLFKNRVGINFTENIDVQLQQSCIST